MKTFANTGAKGKPFFLLAILLIYLIIKTAVELKMSVASSKIENFVQDFIPDCLKSFVVYKFICASCGARYIGETNRHFNTCVTEHHFQGKNF